MWRNKTLRDDADTIYNTPITSTPQEEKMI